MTARVAQALFDHINRHSSQKPALSSVVRDVEQHWHEMAAVAIAAMREPTKSVALAAFYHKPNKARDEMAMISEGAEIWRQMIATALTEDD